jgi:hypothetical protein
MPSFRPKNSKNILVDKRTTTTLDGKHNEYLNIFLSNEKTILPKYIDQKKELIKQLDNSINELSIEKQLDITDQINSLTLEISRLKNEKKKYYLNNSKYIFEYFESKKKITDGTSNKKSLDKFFNINNTDEINYEQNCSNTQKYFRNIDDNYLDINKFCLQTDICQFCNKGEMIPIEYEGIMVCNICSKSIKFLVENEKPSYKEPPKEVCFYAYKRINHFREILAQFQAKETTQIPDEIIENIKLQIKKERIQLKQITNKKTKEILKKLGYNKFYEHIPFIKDKLGIKPPVMTPELEETLCNLFIEIQSPYSKYCPDDRVNFLNYYYTVYKLCELLDQDEFLPYFPMLKDREKRIEQDEIWKKICEELDWEFIPTI